MESLQANEELRVRIFLDLFDQLFIREPEARLDDQCNQCYAKGLRRRPKTLTELRRVIVLPLIPRYELSQLDPATANRKFTAKR